MWPVFVSLVLFVQDSTYACQKHVDCADASSLCFSAQCIRARRLPYLGGCKDDPYCRASRSDSRHQGRGCKFGSCYEIISIPGTRRCDFQEECFGHSICIQHHCVPAEPTGHKCFEQAQCGTGARCIADLCFRPLSASYKYHPPLYQYEPTEFNTIPTVPYAPPVYPHYEQEMQIDAQADLNMPVYDFRPQFPTYAPPSSPPCSEEEGPCCCRAAYFNPY
uniref:EB domain-containing protein n=1 Tax=Trichuris muris TaxID=70415 RepID=A0A5S6R4D3_TRIMR